MSDQGHLNPPQQARSRRTLERIVRAALAILEEEGPDGLTVQSVVARAKSSVGSFYARFGGKDDLLEYLEERIWEEARSRWGESLSAQNWSDLPFAAVAEGVTRLLADAHRSRATYLKALDRMGAGSGDGYGAFRRHMLQGLGEVLLERRTEIRHPDPELAVRLGLAAVGGAVEAGDPRTGQPFATDVIVREGQRLLLAYLGGTQSTTAAPGEPAGESDDEGTVDFFDVWG